ncbi:hypothetical protein JW823_07670 [bacterium]|nr:hypothetical protein [candidate division CSSED10-310 bacterium]
MLRSKQTLILLFLLTLGITVGCNQAPRELPSATLWSDGAWALYDIDRLNTDGTVTQGTLRLASVGKEMVENQLYHWLEIREDSDNGVKITKFLAKEKPLFNPENGFTFWEDVKQVIIQEDANTPEQVPQQHLKRFSPYFVEDNSTRRYGNVQNIEPPRTSILENQTFTVNETPVTCSGVRNTSHFTSSVNLGFLNLEDTTELSVEYFLQSDVPFSGIVKVSYNSTTSSVNKLKPETPPKPPQAFRNTLTLKSYGTGAVTQIMGTPVEMKVMPFPFLETARKKGS